MYCSKCGKKNSDNAKFCIQCGEPFENNQKGNRTNKKNIFVFTGVLCIFVLLVIFYKLNDDKFPEGIFGEKKVVYDVTWNTRKYVWASSEAIYYTYKGDVGVISENGTMQERLIAWEDYGWMHDSDIQKGLHTYKVITYEDYIYWIVDFEFRRTEYFKKAEIKSGIYRVPIEGGGPECILYASDDIGIYNFGFVDEKLWMVVDDLSGNNHYYCIDLEETKSKLYVADGTLYSSCGEIIEMEEMRELISYNDVIYLDEQNIYSNCERVSFSGVKQKYSDNLPLEEENNNATMYQFYDVSGAGVLYEKNGVSDQCRFYDWKEETFLEVSKELGIYDVTNAKIDDNMICFQTNYNYFIIVDANWTIAIRAHIDNVGIFEYCDNKVISFDYDFYNDRALVYVADMDFIEGGA